jgi:hypothetical protein
VSELFYIWWRDARTGAWSRMMPTSRWSFPSVHLARAISGERARIDRYGREFRAGRMNLATGRPEWE